MTSAKICQNIDAKPWFLEYSIIMLRECSMQKIRPSRPYVLAWDSARLVDGLSIMTSAIICQNNDAKPWFLEYSIIMLRECSMQKIRLSRPYVSAWASTSLVDGLSIMTSAKICQNNDAKPWFLEYSIIMLRECSMQKIRPSGPYVLAWDSTRLIDNDFSQNMSKHWREALIWSIA